MPVFVVMMTVFILYLFQGIVYRLFWKKNLDVKVNFSQKQAFYGDKVSLNEVITNRKFLPLPWIWIKFQADRSLIFNGEKPVSGSDKYYRNDLFYLSGYQKISRNLKFTCTKRGYFTIDNAEIIGCDILFQGKERFLVPADTSITVYPKILSDPKLENISTRITGDISARGFINTDPFEFAGIREYTYNDSFRDINFNASCKTGQLMSNIHTPSITRELSVVLYLVKAESRDMEQLWENSISIAATLAKNYISKGHNVELITNCYDCISDKICKSTIKGSSFALTDILENLARIDLKKDFAHIPQSPSSECVVFICPLYDKTSENVFRTIKKDNYGIWILPSVTHMDIDDPYVEVWRDVV